MIELPLIKAHLRIEPDWTAEDQLLTAYRNAAVAYVEQHCDRRLADEPQTDAEMGLTSDVEQAILLLIGHWYANREAVTVGVTPTELPLAVQSLLWTRKRF